MVSPTTVERQIRFLPILWNYFKELYSEVAYGGTVVGDSLSLGDVSRVAVIDGHVTKYKDLKLSPNN